MGTKESDAELDALIAELTGLVGKTGEEDAEYPLPEHKPVKYTNVDVLVMPHGYQHTRTAGESISTDALPLLVSCEIAVDTKRFHRGPPEFGSTILTEGSSFKGFFVPLQTSKQLQNSYEIITSDSKKSSRSLLICAFFMM